MYHRAAVGRARNLGLKHAVALEELGLPAVGHAGEFAIEGRGYEQLERLHGGGPPPLSSCAARPIARSAIKKSRLHLSHYLTQRSRVARCRDAAKLRHLGRASLHALLHSIRAALEAD